MAKKFRLSKSFFAGSSSGSRRSSKAAKGKGIAPSLDVDMERALLLDAMSPEDLGSDWVLPSRLAKARVAAEAKFRELFDSAYEPWKEVCGSWDHSNSEDMDVEDREFPTQSCGGFSASTNFHIGESSRANATLEACAAVETGCLGVVSNNPCAVVSSGCAATQSKIDVCVPVSGSGSEEPSKKLKFGGGGLFRHRPKKVIMGRDFLLVSRRCLRDSDSRFRFFHKASLSAVEVTVHSAVEVTVQEPSLIVSQPCSLDGHVSQEVCVDVLEGDTPFVGVPDLPSPSSMDVVEEIPSSPSSCVTTSSAYDHHKLSVEDSPSDGVEDGFQDSASGPRNLRAKRVVALCRSRMVDCDHAFVRLSGAQKRLKVNSVAGSNGCDQKFSHPFRRKRKRERVIEDDLHSYRAPQRRAVH